MLKYVWPTSRVGENPRNQVGAWHVFLRLRSFLINEWGERREIPVTPPERGLQ